jgi:NADH pyrophosphatase NudC (nudix superfamily)
MADFLDRIIYRIKGGIDRGVTALSVRSREWVEVSRLRSQRRAIEGEMKKALQELGHLVYRLHVDGRLEAEASRIRGRCEALARREQHIGAIDEQIRAAQARVQEALTRQRVTATGTCACGALLGEAARFCGQCGRPVEALALEPAEDAPSPGCQACGEVFPPGARFCGACGARLAAVD